MLSVSDKLMFIGRVFFRVARFLENLPKPGFYVGNVLFIWEWEIDFYIRRATKDYCPHFHFLNIAVVIDDTETLTNPTLDEGDYTEYE